jgi:tRNA pseudouridine38-40 synthase
MERNIRLIIEYEGTDYAGWQVQDNANTVQQVLEEAIRSVTEEKSRLTGSGRTDSGVHARGQMANFFTHSKIPIERISYALNASLPADIRIVEAVEADLSFHAQYHAKRKEYRYTLHTGPHGTALDRRTCVHARGPLDMEAMEAAAKALLGTHDFAAFKGAGSSAKTTVRTVYRAEWTQEGDKLYFDIVGNGFLYNMVRIIVGTLIEVGRGKRSPEDMAALLAPADRDAAGPTAPAKGLCLMRVYY